MFSLDSIIFNLTVLCALVVAIVYTFKVYRNGRVMPSRFRLDKAMLIATVLIVGGYVLVILIVGNLPAASLGMRVVLGAIEVAITAYFVWQRQEQKHYIKQHPQYATK